MTEVPAVTEPIGVPPGSLAEAWLPSPGGRNIVRVRGRALEAGWDGCGSRFTRFLTAATLSLYGDWFTTVALVVLLYRLAGAAAPAGYMVARVLPRLVSGAPGGALADRFQPNRLVAACALGQAALTGSVVASARAGALWAVYSAVVLAQFLGGIARPAVGALVPRVAPPWKLSRANALFNTAASSSIAVGPALAAPVMTLAGPNALLLVDAATFVVAAGLMVTLRLLPMRASEPTTLVGATAGLRTVWQEPHLRALAAASVGTAVAVTAASSVLVLIARQVGSESLVGYLYAAVGGGAMAAGFVALRVRPATVSRDLIVGLAVAEVVTLSLVVLHGGLWVAVLALAASGAAGVLWQTWGTTDMQMRAHPTLLGRVNAVIFMSTALGMTLGASIATGLVGWFGWQHTLFTACCISIAALAVGVVAHPGHLRTIAAD